MNRPFKVGDRVAIYFSDETYFNVGTIRFFTRVAGLAPRAVVSLDNRTALSAMNVSIEFLSHVALEPARCVALACRPQDEERHWLARWQVDAQLRLSARYGAIFPRDLLRVARSIATDFSNGFYYSRMDLLHVLGRGGLHLQPVELSSSSYAARRAWDSPSYVALRDYLWGVPFPYNVACRAALEATEEPLWHRSALFRNF